MWEKVTILLVLLTALVISAAVMFRLPGLFFAGGALAVVDAAARRKRDEEVRDAVTRATCNVQRADAVAEQRAVAVVQESQLGDPTGAADRVQQYLLQSRPGGTTDPNRLR